MEQTNKEIDKSVSDYRHEITLPLQENGQKLAFSQKLNAFCRNAGQGSAQFRCY
jgi:hypothetical protein